MTITLVKVLADYTLGILAINLYNATNTDVFQKDAFETKSGTSQFQCLHTCRRHAQCKDIALVEDDDCLLLQKSEGKGAVILKAQRVSSMMLPGNGFFWIRRARFFIYNECTNKNDAKLY